MLVRYSKNFSNEIKEDKKTAMNIMSTIGHHQTELIDGRVVFKARNNKNICSSFEADASDLNITLYGLSAIDEQYPSSQALDKFYVELLIEAIADTVTLNIDKNNRGRIKDIYQDLVMADFGIDQTAYLIPIPRIERRDNKTLITVVGENWVIDYLTDTFLPITIDHVSTINNYSMIRLEIEDDSTFDVKWLIRRLNTIHHDTRNVKIELNSSDLYFDTELTVQRILTMTLIQDEFKDVSNERVFEVILNLI